MNKSKVQDLIFDSLIVHWWISMDIHINHVVSHWKSMLDPGADFQVEATSRPEHSRIASHGIAIPTWLCRMPVASNASWPGARHSWNHCGPVERTNHLWGALWSACDQIVSRICWTSWNRLWLYNYYKWTLGFGWIWIMISGHNNDWIILEVMGLWSDYDWTTGLLCWSSQSWSPV